MKKSFEQTVPVGKGFVFCATAYFLLYIAGAVTGQISNNSDTVTVAMVISDFTLAPLSALCLLPIQKRSTATIKTKSRQQTSEQIFIRRKNNNIRFPSVDSFVFRYRL